MYPINRIGYYRIDRKASSVFKKIDRIPIQSSKQDTLDKRGVKKDESIRVNHFIKTLKRASHIDLSNFYRNFHAFCFSGKKHRLLSGLYDGKTSTIEYDVNYIDETIYHELLHMASHYKGGTFEAFGFERITFEDGKKTLDIGEALDEGYTQLLTERYFEVKNLDVYTELMNIAMGIESIIGIDKMESLYSKGDLYGLIEAFPSYVDREDIVRLIMYIDYFENNKYFRINKGIDIYSMIILRIVKIIKEGMERGAFSKEDYKYQLHWLNETDKRKYVLFTKKDMNEFERVLDELINKLESRAKTQ